MISKTVTKSRGSQMQAKWIEHNLFNGFERKLARDILKNHETFLTGVSKGGKKIEIFKMTKNTKQLTNIKF